jgi:hypothetical protein
VSDENENGGAPPAEALFVRAAAAAGYEGRTADWARETLAHEALFVLEGRPIAEREGGLRALWERLMRLRERHAVVLARVLMEQDSKVKPAEAVRLALADAVAAEQDTTERPVVQPATSADIRRVVKRRRQ